MMQNLAGIVRREDELQQAMEELKKLQERAREVKVSGNREYNGGWHTALDLRNLLTVSESGGPLGYRQEGKHRRPFPGGLSNKRYYRR